MESDVLLEEIQACLKDLDLVLHEADLGFRDIDSRSFDGVRLGLKEIGTSFKDLPYAISECKPESLYYAGIIKYGSDALINPKSLSYEDGKTIAINGKEIYDEIMQGVEHWKAQEWHDSGVYVGKALIKLFMDQPQTPQMFNNGPISSTVSDFVEGIDINSIFAKLMDCAENSFDSFALILDYYENPEFQDSESLEMVIQEVINAAFNCAESAIVDGPIIENSVHHEDSSNIFHSRGGVKKINLYWIMNRVNAVLRQLNNNDIVHKN